MAPEMTSPTSAACSTRGTGRFAASLSSGSHKGPHAPATRGFTLVELLVVMGIIVLLLGLVGPAILKAWRSGDRAATLADLHAISMALEAYKQDHGDYPRVREDSGVPKTPSTDDAPNPPTGAQILCQALIAPLPQKVPGAAGTNKRLAQDGAEGPGFRTRTQGPVFGPYLAPEKFKVGDPAKPTDPLGPTPKWLLLTILDHYNRPILYFPASAVKRNLNVDGTPHPYVDLSEVTKSEASLYDASDNVPTFEMNAQNALKKIRLMLGDSNANGFIDTGETAYTGPFLLWSGGPNEVFGPTGGEAYPNNNAPDAQDADKCDDITNFRP
jgi:prepilin-type N-terminal cleavage/methylation domain-containing protein